jgi:putative ABC transport system permease protein
MDAFAQDLRFALRTLRKSPAFTAIAVLCLTLGIATNTTLFSVVNAILLRPFPFADPDRLVYLRDHDTKRVSSWASIGYLNYKDWKERARSFVAMGAHSGRNIAITEGEEPERLRGQSVTASLFPTLGVRPQLGRLFREDEDQPGAPGAVLLGDELWHRRYAGDPGVVGRVISINNNPYTVIGVMPPRFAFPENSEIWVPMAPLMSTDHRDWRGVVPFARLKPGVTIEQADREMASISDVVDREHGLDPDRRWVGSVADLRDRFLPDDVRLIVTTMFGAVTFVLLIACANVANLMLARASGRHREIAIRAALGAGRGRIVGQLLTESVMVALMAGFIAVPLTWLGLKWIDWGMPVEDPIPYYFAWSVDMSTLIYTAGISVLTGVVFGLAPALQSSGHLQGALKEGGRGAGTGAHKNRVRNALVVVEVSLSLVLLVGASLFVRSFLSLQHADVGFDSSRIMTMRFFLPGTKYDSAVVRRQRVEDIERRVEGLPGVEAATVSNLIPIYGGPSGDRVIVDGHDVRPGDEPNIDWTGFEGHWFETLGVKLLEGRLFSQAEQTDSVPVAVINHTMAIRIWPNASPVGRRFRLASDSSRTWFSVIGVVPDTRNTQVTERDPLHAMAYLPYRFQVPRNNGLMVRLHSGNPAAITSAVRGVIRAVDPAIPVFNVMPMDKVRALSFWQYALFGAMFGVFGGIALFLAAIGVYGVISYGVSQRTQEIGVRVALGAQRQDVLGMVIRQGMLLAGIGIAFGLAGALGITRVVSSLLVGVSATDPISFAGVALFLTVVALIASWLPARRATTVDPIIALRLE